MRIVVLGAGICGLFAGLLLARDGHDVTLVERDREPVPDTPVDAWGDWSRQGVAQFRQAHYLQPRGRAILEAELPDVAEALAAAGAARFDVLSVMPPTIADRARRPGDERFTTLTARRPVLEHVLARAAEEQAGLEVRRGVKVTGLTTGADRGTARVTGVSTDGGEHLPADLVVDAMGRRSPMPGWISDAASAALYEESEDSGFVYYTRFFRSRGGGLPPFRSAPLTPVGSFTILVLPSDNDTWSVTLYIAAGDRPLKRMRERARWEAVLAACPAHTQWLDGEPLTDVLPMGGIVDRYRRLVVDGRPAITGVALLADAWACTNPSLGRGMALGMLHASHLRDLAREGIDDPQGFALAWDEVTETHVTPWYRDTVKEDRARLREIDALRRGESLPAVEGPPGAAAVAAAMPNAVVHDPEVFRAFIETRACWSTLGDVLARPGVVDRILEVGGRHEPLPPRGPDRKQLLALLN